jgi:hypothetical protein
MERVKGVCPVCKGTGHRPCPDNLREYGVKHGWYGYRAEDDTVDCTNCGAQYMFSSPKGRVPLNRDGQPCVHDYRGAKAGNCLTRYTCVHCDDVYDIDSGD